MALHATLLPDGMSSAGSWTIGGGAASHVAAVSDANDATYVELSNTAGDRVIRFSFSDMAALPAGAVITHLRFLYRASIAVGTGTIRADFIPGGGGANQTGLFATTTIGEADYTLVDFFGPWDATKVNGMSVAVTGDASNVSRVHRIWIEVHTNSPPQAVPLATDPVTVSSLSAPGDPLRNFAYIDDDGDPQYSIQFKTFSGGDTVPDPTTEVLRLVGQSAEEVIYSGTVISLATPTPTGPSAWTVRPNGTYTWTIRAKDVGGTWGPWGQRQIIFDLPVPEAPLLSATPDVPNNRYVISIDDVAGANPTEFFQIQRSDDNGVTWVTVYGADIITFTGVAETVNDYRAPRMARSYSPAMMSAVGYNEPLNYNEAVGYNGVLTAESTGPLNVVRYRGRAGRVYVGTTIWSAWTTITPESLVGDGTMWLKHPTDPAKSILLQQLANWETTSEEDMSILRAAHRQDFVVFAGVPSWRKGELELIFSSDAAHAAFDALRAPVSVIPGNAAGGKGSIAPVAPTAYLFQSCFGDTALEQVWMRLGPTLSTTRVTTGPQQHTNQYRRVKIGFVETLVPA